MTEMENFTMNMYQKNELVPTKAKRYRAHGCREKDCTFIENSAGRKEMFSKLPASA